MTPQTYFITFSTYGTWLHGDDRGSVDRAHNEPGQPCTESDPALSTYRANLMSDPPYRMDESDRAVVLAAVVSQAAFRGWHLSAAHVRTNHVHVVVTADAAPERIMNVFKSYASRALNVARPEDAGRTRWTRHGSTRWLSDDDAIAQAVHYTLYEQGPPMAVFPTPSAPDEMPADPRAATERERLLPHTDYASGRSGYLRPS